MIRKESTLADAIITTSKREQYDASCKRLLSEKTILAWIMKCTMPEYEKFTTKEIAAHYIEGHIEVDAIHVQPDKTNQTPRIIGTSQEDYTITEGSVTFDIKFLAIAPSKDEIISLIVNIEAQSDFYPGYPLVTRGIYYCSRLISSQQDVTFTDSHYADLQKVYSIWICTNPPKYRQNSMSAFTLTEDNIIGNFHEEKSSYDLINTTMLYLGDEDKAEHGTLLRMLDILFSKKLNPKEKTTLLAYEYGLPLTKKAESEVSKMGSLGQAIFDDGFNDGFNDGVNNTIASSIQNLVQNLHLSELDAMKALGIAEESYSEYLDLLHNLS